VVSDIIPQMEPVTTADDVAAVQRYLASGGWLTEFKETRRFASAIRDYTGAAHCVIAPSGTLALFLALKACGISDGDEVIVPDLTMAASATAVILAGGRVVFADIEPETLCLDAAAVEPLLTARTRAIVFVSLNGRAPARFEQHVSRWRGRGLRVIEDAAQSLGSFHQGRHLGTIGDCGILSFSSQKLVTTGQGGAVLTNDEELASQMQLLRDFGRLEGGSDHYLTVGWNLKFTDLQAALGVSQAQRLPAIVNRKREIGARYRAHLGGIDGVSMPGWSEEVTPWFVDVLVDADRKAALIAHLRNNGVGTRPFYPPLHAEPAFNVEGSFPVATSISARGLWLPSSLRLDDQQIDRVCGVIRSFFQ
jgi:perosamine synthetase